MDTHGRPSQGLWTTHAHLREFIGQHDDGIADLKLGVADPAVGLRDAHPFGGRQSLLVEFDRLRRTLRVQVRRHRMVSFRNRFDCHGSNLLRDIETSVTSKSCVVTDDTLTAKEACYP